MKKFSSFNKLCFFALLVLFNAACGNQTTSGDSSMEEETAKSELWLSLAGDPKTNGDKRIVLVTGDEEYRSEEALPQLARILSAHHGFSCTVLFAQDPEKPGVADPNYLHNIPGLEHLQNADLMIIFTRFRALEDEQMQMIDDYLKSGRPVIGIRTSTHAFNFKDTASVWAHYGNGYKGEKEAWTDGFGRLVLGEKWISHHGWHRYQSTRGLIAPGAETHPITTSLKDGDIWGPTDVYGVRLPLPGDAKHIIMGQVINRSGEYDETDAFYGLKPSDDEVAVENPRREASGNPNDPMMPVAWTKSYQIPGGKTGKAFASTIGSSTDFVSEGVRRLFVNAVYWSLDMPPPANANVDLVGEYNPSPYAFHDDEHWDKKNIRILDLEQ